MPVVMPPLLKQAVGDEGHSAPPEEDVPPPLSTLDLDG
jgi:hypothetical protein